MSRSAFVDTSGWYALIDRRDPAHRKAASTVRRLLEGGTRLLTTDYVVDEACTLTRMRAGPIGAERLLELLAATSALDMEWIGPDRFEAAKAMFRKHRDQGYSFTDCTSFVVMEERKITEVLTTDRHFAVRGFQPVL